MVRTILRLEGVALFVASAWFYFFRLDAPWWLFVALLFAPDASMLGYLKDVRWGAAVYNVVHNDLLALALIGGGILLGSAITIALGVILFAHLGIDRTAGYGLKYPTRFQDTHLQRV